MNARFGSPAHVIALASLVVGLIVVLSMMAPNTFPTIVNMQSMMNQIAPLAIMAVSIALTFLIGGIDLSIVAVANGAAITAAMVTTRLGDSLGAAATVIGLVAGIGIGLLAGLLNGLLVSRLRVHPIPITLGTMSVFIGISTGVTKGATVFGSGAMSGLATTTVAFVTLPFIIFLLIVGGISVLTTRTEIGYQMYAVGESAKVARFGRLPVERVQMVVYACSGTLAAIAGLLLFANTNAANVSFGSSYLMQAILIAVVAGVHPYGGTGRIIVVVIAAIAMQVLQTGINMVLGGWSGASFAANFIWGIILILILGLSRYLSIRGSQQRHAEAESNANVSQDADASQERAEQTVK